MTTDSKQDPGIRMRNVLNGQSALNRLPKKRGAALGSMDDGIDGEGIENASPSTEEKGVRSRRKFNFGPPLWTIASILSLTVNVVLFVLLYSAWKNVPTINVAGVTQNVTTMGSGLLGGLYTNFEKMDRAHITRTIPVQTTIPVKFDLPISQNTTVILSQDVRIDNARVTVNTGGLNITNALASIILPQGTNLPIQLNITVPVDTTVPVALNVDVDIPLNETQLHDPFVGLRNVVEPFYCMIAPEALNLDGQPVCK